MAMKYKLRADNNLLPIRRQLLSLLPPAKSERIWVWERRVIAVAFAHIHFGWGIDKFCRRIQSAKIIAQQQGISNPTCSCVELGSDFQVTKKFDYILPTCFFM